MRWDSTVWRRDEVGLSREQVRLACRTAARAVALDKPGESRKIASDRTISAVQRICASDPAIATLSADWDNQRFDLNTPAGVVDLDTGAVRANARGDLFTQQTSAGLGSTCPRWLQFLDEITGGDAELIAYLARVCGYCLTGSTEEHAFFFFYGAGNNGKSVFLQILSAILGTYATTAPLDAFTASASDRHPTDLAGLRGARLVTVTETESDRSWAESRIKAITGGDTIKARFMHRDFFEFRPGFKLIIAGNHRPRIQNIGEAMRRRLHLIPFAVTISDENCDPRLEEKLLAERDGILGWMIAGCQDWQQKRLSPPKIVSGSRDEYFEDEDRIGQWIAEQCDTSETASSRSTDLFASWSDYAQRTGTQRGSMQAFCEALRHRQFRQVRTPKLRGWTGIGLRRGSIEETRA